MASPARTRSLPRPRLRRGIAVAVLLAGAACTFVPAPRAPRPPLPAPSAVAATAPSGAAVLEQLREVDAERSTGTLVLGDERVEFTRLGGSAAGAPSDLVLLVPILAGGESLMTSVANRMRAHGFQVAFCARAGSAMVPPQRGPELQELLRRTVLHQRILLRWLRECERPPERVFVLGISMGGMVSTILGAAEPGIDGLAICLAGGDLATLAVASAEGRVRRWIDWRRYTDGVGVDHITWELRNTVHLEPLRLAPSVRTEKVLFVSATFDDVVPRRHQDLLWEALGRPRRYVVPFGHYTAALAIEPILTAAADHFRARATAK